MHFKLLLIKNVFCPNYQAGRLQLAEKMKILTGIYFALMMLTSNCRIEVTICTLVKIPCKQQCNVMYICC